MKLTALQCNVASVGKLVALLCQGCGEVGGLHSARARPGPARDESRNMAATHCEAATVCNIRAPCGPVECACHERDAGQSRGRPGRDAMVVMAAMTANDRHRLTVELMSATKLRLTQQQPLWPTALGSLPPSVIGPARRA
jgi:hypothetical protein